MKLQINPPSATVCTPDSPINQLIKIANPSKVSNFYIILKKKIHN